MDADARVRALASHQDGVLSRGQLRSSGLSGRQIRIRVAGGHLVQLYGDAFLIAGAPASFRARLRAALIACAPGAVASHGSARALWGLGPEPEGPVEVTVQGHNPGRLPGVKIHRPRPLLASELRTRHGFRCTSPARTICDLAASGRPRGEVEHMVQEGAVRRLVTEHELKRALERMKGRPGARLMRSILDREAGGGFTRSEAERALVELLDGAGLPRPEKNVLIEGHRVDAVWRQQRLIVEIDGVGGHGTALAFHADRAMDAHLIASGWRVMRFTARQLRREPLVVLVRIVQALRPGSGP